MTLKGEVPSYADYDAITTLFLNTFRRDRLFFSFHALGPAFRGLIGVAAYLGIDNTDTRLIEGGAFQINYEEDAAIAEARFTPWLERVIARGLSEWRRTF